MAAPRYGQSHLFHWQLTLPLVREKKSHAFHFNATLYAQFLLYFVNFLDFVWLSIPELLLCESKYL